MKKVWILISWLLQKPADLDPYCFSKTVQCAYKVEYGNWVNKPDQTAYTAIPLILHTSPGSTETNLLKFSGKENYG